MSNDVFSQRCRKIAWVGCMEKHYSIFRLLETHVKPNPMLVDNKYPAARSSYHHDIGERGKKDDTTYSAVHVRHSLSENG